MGDSVIVEESGDGGREDQSSDSVGADVYELTVRDST
jgi:hypothetical protein